MSKTFYIHIGVPKTGSKSIQNALAENREKLLARGVNFFPGAPNLTYTLGSLLSDQPHKRRRSIRRHVDTPEKAEAFKEATGYEITKWLIQNRSPKMVISGEGLSSQPDVKVNRLKQLLAPYAAAFRIIVYVRDHYEYANSASLQRIKGGSSQKRPTIPLPRYRKRIEPYINAFGRENVDIRIFSTQAFVGGQLISDFLVALDEPPELAESLAIDHLNQAISHEAAMILDALNVTVPVLVNGLANRLRAFGFHLWAAGIKGEKFFMDPEAYSEREAEIRTDIEWLNGIIGKPVFGFSAPKPASAPRWGEATIQSIREMLSVMVAEFNQLRAPGVSLPSLPNELAWLRGAYGDAENRRVQDAPQFDEHRIQALACFLNSIALAIQHAKANNSARRGRPLIWRSPRRAEKHFREVVRLNPGNASAQLRLSQAQILRGHFGEARASAQAAVRLAPYQASYRWWLNLANAAAWLLYKPLPIPLEPARRKPRSGRRPARQQGAGSQSGG